MFQLCDGATAESEDIINRNGRPSAMRKLRKFSSAPEQEQIPSKKGNLSKKQPSFPGKWQQRYVEVKNRELRYFKQTKQSEGLTMAGTLHFELYLCEVKAVDKHP